MNHQKHSLLGAILLALGLFSGASIGAAKELRPACEPFSVHRNASPLNLWKNSPVAGTKSPAGEKQLVDEIARIKTYESFAEAYGNWERTNRERLTNRQKQEWLLCIRHYAIQDADKDGIPDWRAITDAKPSRILFPQDDDIDGDGTDNVLDPEPFNARVAGSANPNELPPHLLSADERTAELQRKLFKEFKIIAIEHTGDHSPLVLENLMFLLRHGFKNSSSWRLSTFKYIYAFSGHDTSHDMAAFHADAKAISIGDRETYPDSESLGGISIPILTTLAHEIGHAFLFEKVKPAELKKISKDFGGWGPVFDDAGSLNFFSRAFFMRHPLRRFLRTPSAGWNPAEFSVASTYALSNVHEWFADAFAASTLKRLGQSGLLGKGWEKQLAIPPKRFKTNWTNYNNVSTDFHAWVGRKLRD